MTMHIYMPLLQPLPHIHTITAAAPASPGAGLWYIPSQLPTHPPPSSAPLKHLIQPLHGGQQQHGAIPSPLLGRLVQPA
jgi:hypothetical protein